jgi:hypothetical protein
MPVLEEDDNRRIYGKTNNSVIGKRNKKKININFINLFYRLRICIPIKEKKC